jgi:hypothetical protein
MATCRYQARWYRLNLPSLARCGPATVFRCIRTKLSGRRKTCGKRVFTHPAAAIRDHSDNLYTSIAVMSGTPALGEQTIERHGSTAMAARIDDPAQLMQFRWYAVNARHSGLCLDVEGARRPRVPT